MYPAFFLSFSGSFPHFLTHWFIKGCASLWLERFSVRVLSLQPAIRETLQSQKLQNADVYNLLQSSDILLHPLFLYLTICLCLISASFIFSISFSVRPQLCGAVRAHLCETESEQEREKETLFEQDRDSWKTWLMSCQTHQIYLKQRNRLSLEENNSNHFIQPLNYNKKVPVGFLEMIVPCGHLDQRVTHQNENEFNMIF